MEAQHNTAVLTGDSQILRRSPADDIEVRTWSSSPESCAKLIPMPLDTLARVREPPDVSDELVTSEPDRFFSPQPSASGVFGDWIGVYLDTTREPAVDGEEIAAIIEEAYRLRAPKRLVAELERRSPGIQPRGEPRW